MTAHPLRPEWFEPWWGFLGGVLWIGFWALVVVLLVAVLRRRPHGGGGATSAIRLLEERYARGEITRDEFLERRQVLLGEDRSP
ncbi:MAG TPA: SHOCT domain-containing protein [Actinomycetota bacterium]|nr:SHOCT domain-containing protein [Actinomycetota bacterium]